MVQIFGDPWNTSNSVPHFTPLKSAEYLTDPAVIKAYQKLCEAPDDQIRFLRRISRKLHFGIWIRSVAWSLSLVFAIALAFMMIVRMDFHMKSLIYPQTTVFSEEETDDSSKTVTAPKKAEERVTEKDGPVIR